MSTSESKLPWYQFSLRSLLLFTAFVAVLCSIGVSTGWRLTSLFIMVGLPLGIIVARAKEGVFVCGFQFFLIALCGCGFLFAALSDVWAPAWSVMMVWSTSGPRQNASY